MTILYQNEILDYKMPTWCRIVLLILGAIAIGLELYSFYDVRNKTTNTMANVMLAVFIIYGVSTLLFLQKEVPTGRYRYECTIDEDTSFAEVCEKYDVVEQKGDIWILEDKE